MNCYCSNLIEGHDTHPVDIGRALKADYSTDPEQRNLQLEARAHVAVQAWIDGGGLRGRTMTVAAIRECHERFGNLLPEELLSVKDPDTGEEEVVIPGEFRKRDVKAAQHVPVSPGAVPRFLARLTMDARAVSTPGRGVVTSQKSRGSDPSEFVAVERVPFRRVDGLANPHVKHAEETDNQNRMMTFPASVQPREAELDQGQRIALTSAQ